MSDDKKGSTTFRSATFRLDSVLKGEIMYVLSGTVETVHVQRMIEAARPRIQADAFWTIGAADVVRVTSEAYEAMKNGFDEFRKGGGVKIVVFTPNPHVAARFRSAAFHAGNVEIAVVATYTEARAIGQAFREDLERRKSKKP